MRVSDFRAGKTNLIPPVMNHYRIHTCSAYSKQHLHGVKEEEHDEKGY